MGKMMWQAVRHHDRERFAVHFYSLSSVRDEWTERFVSAGDRFEVVAGLPERVAAARIAADDLDLLVDLSGHTKGGKPGILAAKPARVQITHVASAGSVGLATVDFKLTDTFADVPGNQDWMIETLLPMAGCVYPYRHVEPAATNPFTRQALGIASDAVVLGAFVTPMKLSRRCLSLWRDILARVPRAVLAFSPTQVALRPVFERLCSAAGIPRERLAFVPQGRDDAENQCRYALVDFEFFSSHESQVAVEGHVQLLGSWNPHDTGVALESLIYRVTFLRSSSGFLTQEIPACGRVTPEAPAAEPAQCSLSLNYPGAIQQWCPLLEKYSGEFGLEPSLIAAVMLQESGGHPDAYSKSGAVGLKQVMPRDGLAASFMCINGPCFSSRPSMDELFDPEFNVAYGVRMLAGLIQRSRCRRPSEALIPEATALRKSTATTTGSKQS